MRTKRKTAVGRAVSWIAAGLAVLTVVGALAALAPRRDTPETSFPAYGSSEAALVKVKSDFLKSGETLTAASYSEGRHVIAIDGTGPSEIREASDGVSWENHVISYEDVNDAYSVVVDELLNFEGAWFFGLNHWNDEEGGRVYRCRNKRFDTTDFSSFLWTRSTVQGRSDAGDLTCLTAFGANLCAVDETGYLWHKVSNGVFSLVGRPFEGARVYDLEKCGNAYLALGADAEGTVLYTATSLTGAWAKQRLDGIRANSFATSDKACFIACDDGKIAYSEDFKSWKISRMPDDVDFSEFFYFQGTYYAIGSNENVGVLYESATGAAWERVASVDEPLTAVSVGSDEALLYGEDGGVYRLTK